MLELKNVEKAYGEKVVIPGLDLSLIRGEISFICGTSGAGKSTILQLIGLLDSPTGGEISVDGAVISGLSEEERCRYRAENIAFLFQDNNLIGGLSLRQNIQTALALSHKEKGEEEIRQVLGAFGIEKVYEQTVETLSGGERQRACIAIAFLKDAKIILADEPTGNLDHENALKVLSELSRVKGDRYVVVISHDIDLAENFADRIVTLSDGKIISDKKAASVGERKDDPEADGSAPVDGGAEKGVAVNEGASADGVKKPKKHFDFKTLFSYGGQKLKKRLKSFIIILITTALAFGSVLATMNLYTTVANVNKYVNEDYFSTDMVIIDWKVNAGLTEEGNEVAFLKETAGLKDSDVKELVPSYSVRGTYLYFSAGEDMEKIETPSCIELDEFFRNRLSSYKIEGGFPENDREIVLGQDLAEKLKISAGDTGYIVVMGQPVEVKVSGVNHTKSYGGEYKTYLANSLMKDLAGICNYYQPSISADVSLAGENDAQRTAQVGVKRPEEEVKMLYGREPAAPGEIVLDSAAAYRVLYRFTEYRPTIEEIRDGSMPEEMQTALFSVDNFVLTPGTVNNGKRQKIKVVGVSFIDTFMTDEFYREFTTAVPKEYRLYLKDYTKWESVKNNLGSAGITSIAIAEDFESDMIGSSRIVLYFVILLCFILCLLSILLIHSYVKLSVTERMYEIGVLKTWGAGKREIRKVLSFDFLLLGVCSAILAVLVGVGIQNLFPLFVKDLPVSVKLSGWNFLAVAAFDFIIVLCASLSSSGRAGKIPPAALIRERM